MTLPAHHSPPKIDATGAKWWRVDFHAHTPHSWDAYRTVKNKDGKPTITEREWLLAHMKAGLDAVAITDHNGGGWIDTLKAENARLAKEEPKPADYRPLTLFPGVEITVSDGFHLLVLLDPQHGSHEITSLLGTSIDVGDHGSHEAKSRESVTTLLDKLVTQDCIVIPAHVNGPKGLLRDKLIPSKSDGSSELEPGEVMLQTDSRTREHVLKHTLTYAIESFWKTALVFDPKSFGVTEQKIVVVHGSDSHERDQIGRRSTWVRMGEPTLDGLRVALLDGAASVCACVAGQPDPGPHSAFVLRRISIAGTKYIGRQPPLVIELNPSFNAIIGGRGTGKSSIIELVRKATKRDVAVERTGGELARNLSDLLQSITTGLPACIEVDYELHGTVFRMRWEAQTGFTLFEDDLLLDFQPVADGGTWTERFPLRIFSQKQLYGFKDHTAPLLNEVDGTTEVGGATWQREWDRLVSEFIQLRARIQTLNGQLGGRADLEAKLKDKQRQLEVLEKAGHKTVLRELALRRRQRSEIEKWAQTSSGIVEELQSLAGKLAFEFGELRLTRGTDGDSDVEDSLEETAKSLVQTLEAESDAVLAVATRIQTALGGWHKELAASDWSDLATKSESDYTALLAQLQGGDIRPEQYGELVQDMNLLQRQLDALATVQKEITDAREQMKARFAAIKQQRQHLTSRRRDFLAKQFDGSGRLRAELDAYGDITEGVAELRNILGRDPGVSDSEFERITSYLQSARDENDREQRMHNLKQHLATRSDDAATATGLLFGKPFLSHLASRTSEDTSRLWTWFPPDLLRLSYRTGSEGFKPLDKGSPGQVAAAVLAFLLAYGEEPMILDQPEDDLDNRLIYDLIVDAIHINKLRRQLIIVTHNPNIVVNGNADLVFPLEERGGQTTVPCSGSLQSIEVRKAVCEIMEGGQEALERRFRQIIN